MKRDDALKGARQHIYLKKCFRLPFCAPWFIMEMHHDEMLEFRSYFPTIFSFESMTISYIPFTIDLYDEVYRLWQTSEGVGLSEADSRENIERFIDRNPDTNIVAKIDGVVAGVCLGGYDGRRGYIHHLAVAERHRRKGVGSGLVAACLQKLQKLGVQKCHLFIFQTNGEGIAFWRSQGWFYRDELAMMSMTLK